MTTAQATRPATVIHTTYYVSTGKLNAMFTLRSSRTGPMFSRDNYICNLATDIERAEAKALDYFLRIKDRIASPTHIVSFGGADTDQLARRRGKLSTRDTASLEAIEAGVVPFGKNAGKLFADCEDGWLLFWADKSHTETEVVVSALADACMGVALERNLIAKREQAKAERAEADALSVHVGTVGERLTFEGEVVSSFFKAMDYEPGYFITKVRCGGNLVTYIGNELGKRGEVIKFKATVKRHDNYQGVLSTVVNRPKRLDQ